MQPPRQQQTGSETGAASRCADFPRHPWKPRRGAPHQRPAKERARSCSRRHRTRPRPLRGTDRIWPMLAGSWRASKTRPLKRTQRVRMLPRLAGTNGASARCSEHPLRQALGQRGCERPRRRVGCSGAVDHVRCEGRSRRARRLMTYECRHGTRHVAPPGLTRRTARDEARAVARRVLVLVRHSILWRSQLVARSAQPCPDASGHVSMP
jgi:hypothetical protein